MYPKCFDRCDRLEVPSQCPMVDPQPLPNQQFSQPKQTEGWESPYAEPPPHWAEPEIKTAPAENPAIPVSALVRLQQVERSLRSPIVAIAVPLLPPEQGEVWQARSQRADEVLAVLAAIDLARVGPRELHLPRLWVGLVLTGSGALLLLLLLLYLSSFYPRLDGQGQMQLVWGPYVAIVSLGLTGLFMLGREVLRRDWMPESLAQVELMDLGAPLPALETLERETEARSESIH